MMATGGCCQPRHGLIIRGDWSLECNRVPWLVKRTESLDECSVPSDGYPGPYVPEASEGTEVCGQGPVGHGVPGSAGVGGLGRFCLGCGRLLGLGPAQAARASGYYAHPRFHPVPTRPVFRPPTEYYSSITAPEDQEPMGAADVADPTEIEPSPLPPPVELIPTPTPELGEDWIEPPSPQPQGASGSSRSTAPLPAELKLSVTDPSELDARAVGSRVTR